MQERPRQVNSKPETIHGATMTEEIPASCPEAIEERTPIENRTKILLVALQEHSHTHTKVKNSKHTQKK